MKNALIYCRVSTEEQAKHGYSLFRQEQECREFALKQGYEVVKVFVEEGESAKTLIRTQLKEMWEYCSKNADKIDAIIFWKWDRLSRGEQSDYVALANFFNACKIKPLSVTEVNDETPEGELLRWITQGTSLYELRKISQRTKNGMKGAIEKGRFVNLAPIGYLNDEKQSLVPDPATANYVKKAFRLFATGLYTQQDIILQLRKEGLKNINKNKLSNLLKRHVYRGYVHYPQYFDEPIKGIFEPLIDDETFFKVQAILEGRKPQITGYKRNNPDFPLRNYIACPNCNQPLTGGWSKGNGGKYAYYHCKTKECDCKLSIKKENLENAFVEHLKEIKPDKSLIKLFRAIIEDIYNKNTQEQKELYSKLSEDLLELTERKSKLLDLYIDGKLQEDDYNFKKQQIDASITSKKMDIADTKLPERDLSKCLDWCCFTFSNVQKIWIEGSLDLRQRFQKLIYPKGLTYDTEKFRTNQKSIIFNTFEDIRNNQVINGADDGT